MPVFPFPRGGGGAENPGETTYGPLTNVQIDALSSPSDGQTAYSTDELTTYTFLSGAWTNSDAGVLIV